MWKFACNFVRVIQLRCRPNVFPARFISTQIARLQSIKFVDRNFPSNITCPNYYTTQSSDEEVAQQIISDLDDLVRDSKTIDGVRKAAFLAKTVLATIGQKLKPGMSGDDVDELVYQQCLLFNCYPSPLFFCGFPKCVTISTNDTVVHGIPDSKPFQVGDLVSVDVSVYFQGYHGDTAYTFLLGNEGVVDFSTDNLSAPAREIELLRAGQECLYNGIRTCRAGISLKEVAEVIERTANQKGFNVIPAVCGHSIGEYFHGPPDIAHIPIESEEQELILKENMIITLEPAICEGEPDVELLEDGWTVVTASGSKAVQFEHTILIQKNEAIILT